MVVIDRYFCIRVQLEGSATNCGWDRGPVKFRQQRKMRGVYSSECRWRIFSLFYTTRHVGVCIQYMAERLVLNISLSFGALYLQVTRLVSLTLQTSDEYVSYGHHFALPGPGSYPLRFLGTVKRIHKRPWRTLLRRFGAHRMWAYMIRRYGPGECDMQINFPSRPSIPYASRS